MALLSFKWLFILLLSVQLPDNGLAELDFGNVSNRNFHPFYVSVTEINHNVKEQSIEVSCKIFADDMEDILKKNYKTTVDLSNAKQQSQNDKLIADYINRNLSFVVDGKPARLNYVGFEKESESVYCYFEVVQVPSIKKLDVTNSMLQDFSNQQINIMHVTVNGSRKSYKLDYPHKQANFNF